MEFFRNCSCFCGRFRLGGGLCSKWVLILMWSVIVGVLCFFFWWKCELVDWNGWLVFGSFVVVGGVWVWVGSWCLWSCVVSWLYCLRLLFVLFVFVCWVSVWCCGSLVWWFVVWLWVCCLVGVCCWGVRLFRNRGWGCLGLGNSFWYCCGIVLCESVEIVSVCWGVLLSFWLVLLFVVCVMWWVCLWWFCWGCCVIVCWWVFSVKFVSGLWGCWLVYGVLLCLFWWWGVWGCLFCLYVWLL